MPEYWFRYGNVEIPVEIDEEVRVEKISIDPIVKYDYTAISKLTDQLTDSRDIAILYEYASNRDLDLLRTFIAELEARGFEKDKIKVLASSWRIDWKTLEEELEEILKPYRKSLVFSWNEDKVEFRNMMISRSILEASSRVVITSMIPHGVIGFPSIKENLLLSKWIMFKDENSDLWSILKEELKFLGLVIGGDTLFYGDLGKIEEECKDRAEKTHTVKIDEAAEILLVDAGGRPWDSTLESSLHLIRLVSDGVVEGGLIGLIGECGRGLGSTEFIEALFSQEISRDALSGKILKIVKEVVDVKKLALVTTIPRSILGKTLNAKGFDSPQDLLTYGFRMYSKQASVKIVNGLGWLTR
ncbi:MAG: hypothetical protein NZ929_06315 [Aigarchaeota archaeon]|nr:hypothetical protein [Aigarchaeota archaeon]MDW7986653.1 hypothetical protein [Nitrososphaerota archaeon]